MRLQQSDLFTEDLARHHHADGTAARTGPGKQTPRRQKRPRIHSWMGGCAAMDWTFVIRVAQDGSRLNIVAGGTRKIRFARVYARLRQDARQLSNGYSPQRSKVEVMIWFACKQCGKTHGRPDSAIGATIFCDCGCGLLVPWESTAAEPSTPVIVADMPLAFKLEPVTFDPVASKSELPTPVPPPRQVANEAALAGVILNLFQSSGSVQTGRLHRIAGKVFARGVWFVSPAPICVAPAKTIEYAICNGQRRFPIWRFSAWWAWC